jgi:hypothetical protein
MSRKDYELLAATLASFANLTSAAPIGATTQAIAEALCNRLELDNPRFNRRRFIAACGLEAGS